MANRITMTKLNASTIDILNTIRANASYEYQQLVPKISETSEIVKVGDVLYGYPTLANQFINALVNRIALVNIKSATFNNAYAELKKGYLEYGETVEEVFVSIAKAREFSVEKAEARELKRTLPNVKTAFHTMNFKAQYPITIQDEDLRQAFMSVNGVQDLIAKIINSVYVAVEYDEYLLFKYLLIKAISHGKMFPVSIGNGDLKECAKKFRGMSNQITFMSDKYNADGVTTTTPKDDQYIFMDAMFNADYDVEVLASAFNMDKATFSGKLKLIDDWTSFDNDRFKTIIDNSDQMELVTADELALMQGVKAVLVDKEWFQVYDNNNKMTETYVASGQYWNYFYNVWKTVSSSPFSNAIVFATDEKVIMPTQIKATVDGVDVSDVATILTLDTNLDAVGLVGGNVEYLQTRQATEKGVAIQKYGAVVIPKDVVDNLTLEIKVNGTTYYAQTTVNAETVANTQIVFKTTKPSTTQPGA